jgi:hypothetical protein
MRIAILGSWSDQDQEKYGLAARTAQPAEHGAATSPGSVRLFEEAAGRLQRTASRRNSAAAALRICHN